MQRIKQRSETVAAYGTTITVTALRWLSREFLPYALVRVIDVLWFYALLGVIDVWWLYSWHVGVTALVAFCGIAWFALYKKGRKPVKASPGTSSPVTRTQVRVPGGRLR
jgi:hypothetical protein